MRGNDVEREYSRAAGLLRKHRLDVHIPQLRHGGRSQGYTVGALMLVFFSARVGKVATKGELVTFLRKHRCRTHDPQPRHMGMQLGLNFLVAGCWHPQLKRVLRRGEYCLLDLSRVHPSRAAGINHRARGGLVAGEFDRLKTAYGNRCACCGSVEGQPHLKNALLVTSLERGHLDPRRPLTGDNCIPICRMCNMVYKNRAVLSRRGFVVSWHKEATSSSIACPGVYQVISGIESSKLSEKSASADSNVEAANAEGADNLAILAKRPGLLQRIRSALLSFWPVPMWTSAPVIPAATRERPIRRSGAFFGAGNMSLFD